MMKQGSRISLMTWSLAVFLAGLLAGTAMWYTALDVRLQAWLWLNYSQPFNTLMRVFGQFGLGRSQLMACALAGLLWALKLHARDSEEKKRRLLWRLMVGMVEQEWLWLRGRWQWAKSWNGVTVGPKVLLAVVPLMGLAGLGQLLMKFVIGRPRPKMLFFKGVDPFDVQPFGLKAGWWSFPSGHSVSTFAVLVWLALWFPKWRLPAFAAAVVLASSRFLAVTPHYLGDVIAGAGMGAAVAMAVYALMREHPHV